MSETRIALRPRFPWCLLRFWARRLMPAWCLIALALFLIQIAVCGISHDNERVKALLGMLDVMPSFFKSMIGGDELQVGNVTAFIAIGYRAPEVYLLFMLYAVGVPTALLAGEVHSGNMELILSRAVTKTQVYLCAWALTVTGMFALVLVLFLGTVVGTTVYTFQEPVNLGFFFKAAISGGLLSSAIGGISLMIAASFNARSTAVAVACGYLVVSYVVSVLTKWWPVMEPLSPFTPFHYVDGAALAQPGWPIGDTIVLLALLTVTSIAGGIIWNRRDLPL